MPPKSFKTTETDFEIFKASCQRWLEFFGLKSWEVSFAHNDKHIENRATCEAELGARYARFTLTKSKWTYKPDQREVDLLGFHEVCELLLWGLVQFAEARHPEGDINDITHAIIRQLENSVWAKLDCESTCKAKLDNIH